MYCINNNSYKDVYNQILRVLLNNNLYPDKSKLKLNLKKKKKNHNSVDFYTTI